ncbi:MAG: serine/threonine-protein kinase [Vicinamibacterales bacterium]
MSPQEWQRAKPVLSVAAGLAGHQRARLIEAEFPDEPTLRREVLVMLETHDTISRALGPVQLAALSASSIDNFTGPPASDDETLTIGVRYGPYRVIRRLGAGGMGQVFLAEDTRLGRHVALKSLAGRWLASPNARQRLLLEARAVAALSHPHIATLYDVLEDGEHLLLVMEYVEGRTAAALVAEGPLPLIQALRLASQIVDAVVYAHDHGIVHCDLKPLNVQVATDGTAKVLDFGLAHAAGHSSELDAETDVPQVRLIGTPPYMPPERLLTGTLNRAGDIYSLGVTLFELVTGQRPFQESSFALLTGAILGTTPPPASSIASDCPDSLDSVIAHALEKDPKRRFRTARELGAAVQTVLDQVEPAGTTWRARVLIGLAAIASAIIIPMILGFIITATFNQTFGRDGSFGVERPLDWFQWGVKSLVSPFVYMTALATVVVAVGFVVRVLSLFGPITGARRAIGQWFRALEARLGLDDPVVLGQGLAAFGLVAIVLVLWGFLDLLVAVTGTTNLSSAEMLAPLAPDASVQRSLYRGVLDILILTFSFGVFRVVRQRRQKQVREGIGALIVAIAIVIVLVLANLIPFRIMFHNEFEAAEVAGTRCYVIRDLATEVLMFCPDAPPPRNRIMRRTDPSIRRLGVIENVFTPPASRGGI